MKPAAIFISVVAMIACLSGVVWVGRYKGHIPTTAELAAKGEPTQDDVPVPKTGPFAKVEAPELEFDFGTALVSPTRELEHTFTVKNAGEGKMDFILGKPTCQCTKVEVAKADGTVFEEGKGSLQPGDSMTVFLRWAIKTKNEKFRHGVKLFTSDPEKRSVDLYVHGVVDTAFFFRPEGIWDLGELPLTEPGRAEGSITSTIHEQFMIEELPRDNPHVKVNFSPVDPATMAHHGVKCGYFVKIEAGPTDVPVGTLRESIKVRAWQGDDEQIVEFTVTGRRTGPIEVRGVRDGATFNVMANRLIFQDFPADKGKTVQLTMFVRNLDEDLILKSVEPADTRFKVNLSEGKMLGKSKSYVLSVEIPPGPPGRHRGNDAEIIHLMFNHPEVPDFELMLDYNAVR